MDEARWPEQLERRVFRCRQTSFRCTGRSIVPRHLALIAAVVWLGLTGYVQGDWVDQDQPRPAPRALKAGGISLVLPPGWQHAPLQGAPDVTVLRPEGIDDSAVWVAIPPGEQFRGDLLEWVRNLWSAFPYATKQERVQQGRTPSGEEWAMIAAMLHGGLEGFKPVVLQVLADGSRVLPIFWYFRDEDSQEAFGSDVDDIARSVRLLPPQERASPRAVALGTLVPPTCIGCAHTFTGAPPATPGYVLGTWATGRIDRHFSGDLPQYADGRLYTFRADGTYESSGSMQAAGVGSVVVHEDGRYTLQGHRITLERLRGEINNNGRTRALAPGNVSYDWRPAIGIGTKQPMLVFRSSPDQEWEGYFRK
jgi:hypothetical protein